MVDIKKADSPLLDLTSFLFHDDYQGPESKSGFQALPNEAS